MGFGQRTASRLVGLNLFVNALSRIKLETSNSINQPAKSSNSSHLDYFWLIGVKPFRRLSLPLCHTNHSDEVEDESRYLCRKEMNLHIS